MFNSKRRSVIARRVQPPLILFYTSGRNAAFFMTIKHENKKNALKLKKI